MIERIRKAAKKAGLEDLDGEFGGELDSLMMVLMVSELEREFKIKIPAEKVTEQVFLSFVTVEHFLRELGAK